MSCMLYQINIKKINNAENAENGLEYCTTSRNGLYKYSVKIPRVSAIISNNDKKLFPSTANQLFRKIKIKIEKYAIRTVFDDQTEISGGKAVNRHRKTHTHI